MRMFTVRHPDTASGNYMDSEHLAEYRAFRLQEVEPATVVL